MWVDAEEGRSTYKPLEVHWSQVPGRDAAWKEETVRNTSEEQFRQEFEWGQEENGVFEMVRYRKTCFP